MEHDQAVIPHLAVCAAVCPDLALVRRVVRSQRALATANRAVALGDVTGSLDDVEYDFAVMTECSDHEGSCRCLLRVSG